MSPIYVSICCTQKRALMPRETYLWFRCSFGKERGKMGITPLSPISHCSVPGVYM